MHAPPPGAAAEALRAFGARDAEMDELLAYTRNAFTAAGPVPLPAAFPLPDEPFVAAWEEYAALAGGGRGVEGLRPRLVQLLFDVAEGASGTEAYRAATRRGVPPAAGEGLRLCAPGRVQVWVHPTPAGRIGVMVAEERADFVRLVQAFTRRNEPEPVPDSMGACMVAGYNNWDRVARLRRDWARAHPHAPEAEWAEAFRALVPRKELYQDRFILLSSGPYSAVPARALGLREGEWRARSLRLRLEHECAHYFTRRVLGSMRNALHDELIADFAGITAAAGRFRADWFLRFMGLEAFPAVRPGGRIHAYRGTPPLSEAAFAVVAALLVAAAHNVQALGDAGRLPARTLAERGSTLAALARTGLVELASARAAQHLACA